MSEAGQFLSDADDHFPSNGGKVEVVHLDEEASALISPLEMSRALQARLGEVRGVDSSTAAGAPEELTRRLRMNIEAMHVELAELLHETPWKDWKSYPADGWYDRIRLMAIKEEVIDLYFFLNNMFIALGVDDQEIHHLYEMKFKKNMERQADGGAYR